MAQNKHHWYRGCRLRSRRDALPYAPALFVEQYKGSPDWYCSACAKAARLALAAESAPKPSDVVWPKPRPISDVRETEILGYCPGLGWRRLSQMGRRWALTGAEHIADYEPTHFLPLPPEVR